MKIIIILIFIIVSILSSLFKKHSKGEILNMPDLSPKEPPIEKKVAYDMVGVSASPVGFPFNDTEIDIDDPKESQEITDKIVRISK